jgi:hypothetical protein
MSWIAGLLWLVVVFGGSLAMWIMIIKGLRHTFE